MGLVADPKFMRNTTETTHFFLNAYTKNGVILLKINFLVCLTRTDKPRLALQTPIQNLKQQMSCTHPTINLKILSKLKKWKKELPKFHPTLREAYGT